MCSAENIIFSSIALGILFSGLIIYLHRLNKYFLPKKRKYICIVWILFICNGIVVGFQIVSDCDRQLLNFACISFAFYFCLTVIETCTYLFNITL